MSEFPLTNSQTYFPFQKRTDKEKSEKFFKDCIDSGVALVNWNITNLQSNTSVRASRKNKITNYRLYNDIVDKAEMERVMNPFQLQDVTFPSTYRNYPLINPNIAVLVGEERKRLFNPIVTATSADAINSKNQVINQRFQSFVTDTLTSGMTDEKQIEEEMVKFEKWRKYEFKDIRERMATQILEYHYKTQDLKEVFSRGFEDLLIAGEEIYVIDIIGGEPILRKGNPLNFYTLRGGESYKIEDSDIIVEDGYLSVGETIDRFHEFLTDKDISRLEQGYTLNHSGSRQGMFNEQLNALPFNLEAYAESLGVDNLVVLNQNATLFYNGSFDTAGNVRVTRVVWRGMRKVGFKYWYDETGTKQTEIVPEQYKPRKELGEEVKWEWISEWYEGTRIANEIYVKFGPLEFQSRHIDNPSICSPGIIGTINNVNSNKSKSLIDYIKEYQYLYNAIMYRTELAIAKYLGKVGTMDISMKPDGMDMDKWMYYMYTMNLKFEDPYNEVNKGVAMGKNFGNNGNRTQNIEVGDPNIIQSNLVLLEFLRGQIDAVCGITPQRKGAVDNRETVGGVERSVTQSSVITEKWYGMHDNTRVRALRALVEASKVAWKNKSFKKQYMMDDGTLGMLDYDDMMFREADYDVDISTTNADSEMFSTMKSLIPQMIQNGTPNSIVMDLLRTKNPSSLQRKIETFEAEQAQLKQQEMQQEKEIQMQQIESVQAMEQAKLDQELALEYEKLDLQQYKIDADNATKIQVAEMNTYIGAENQDLNANGIPDPMEISKFALETQKANSDQYNNRMEQISKSNEFKRKEALEKRKLNLEEKKIKSQEKMKKQELDTQLRIAKENKGKYDSKK